AAAEGPGEDVVVRRTGKQQVEGRVGGADLELAEELVPAPARLLEAGAGASDPLRQLAGLRLVGALAEHEHGGGLAARRQVEVHLQRRHRRRDAGHPPAETDAAQGGGPAPAAAPAELAAVGREAGDGPVSGAARAG